MKFLWLMGLQVDGHLVLLVNTPTFVLPSPILMCALTQLFYGENSCCLTEALLSVATNGLAA